MVNAWKLPLNFNWTSKTPTGLPFDFRKSNSAFKMEANSASKMKVLDKVKREVWEVEWKSNGSPTEVLELKLK